MIRKSRVGLALATSLTLMAGVLSSVTAPVAADPIQDCNFVPLKYEKNYVTGGEQWKAKANLRVYDICEEGTIRGRVLVKGRSRTSLADISPTTPRLAYQRHNDTSYRNTWVAPLQRQPLTSNGWRPYGVTTGDITLRAGWFMGVRIRWTVTVDGRQFTRTVVCDRIYTEGARAYLCRNV